MKWFSVIGMTIVAVTAGCSSNAGAPATASAKDAYGCGAVSVKTVVVAPEYDNKRFDVVVTAQAGDAGDDAYLHDAQTILTGMEIKAPPGR
jgi:hypothetical protein